MAALPRPGLAPGTDVFDSYFRRADLDQDGKISGAEAVAFFQGSNLPKPVLAQIWTYADQNRAGFLGRQEFYNALKLVTVAQSGRELTPEIVKSALYGPAAAKIPPPQINPVSPPAAQMNSMAAATTQPNSLLSSSTQLGATGPNALQNLGFRGAQAPATAATNQQFFSSNSNFMRPPQAMPPSASLVMQGVNQAISGVGSAGPRMPGSNAPNLSSDWLSGRTGGVSVGGISQVPVRGVSPSPNTDGFGLPSGTILGAAPKSQTQSVSTSSVLPKPVESVSSTFGPKANDSNALVASGNGFSSDSIFGGDAFSATSQVKPDASTPKLTASSMPNPSSISAAPVGFQSINKAGQLDPLQSTLALPSGAGQLQQTQPVDKQNQLDKLHDTSTHSVSSVSAGPASSATSQSQLQWPKFNQSLMRKYAAVFMEVDKDRDGKITGEQARNLFLSWRLPREVLKQVWDLSDQDNDSMLSLREFCIALYLMERYREGRPIPAVLPNTVKYDEVLLQATSQPSTAYSGPGFPQQSISGSYPIMPSTGMGPPVQPSIPSQIDGAVWLRQQKSRGPGLENHMAKELNRDEQSAVNSKNQETTDAEKKVQESNKILDSREKLEFYRTKMQELVLYKSRCDNRLNEITEKASADKREVESLAKKYEEKYKQVGELASTLAVEENKFRDIQERKLELQNAIVKMEQGGSADGLLQVRVDRIQRDFEELEKALNERCKHQGLHVKPATMIELPFGWEPGTQDGAADWDEDWEKFDDEGFTIVKDLTDLTIEVDNKSPSVWSDKASTDEFSPVATSSNVDSKTENLYGSGERINGVAYDPGEEESARSPPSSAGRSSFESPFQSTQFGMHDNSPHSKESHSDHGGVESTFSGDKYTDEPSWTFDDTDSVWGSSTINIKDSDHERSTQNDFFVSGSFGLNPIKVYSPNAASAFGKERKSPFFEDSVPSSPMFSSGASPRFSSPRFNERKEDYSFNSFGRFDSFRTNDSGSFPPHDSFSRFDSIRSTQGPGFSRFDSIRSTQGVGFSRFDSIRSTQGANLARSDSINSTKGFGHSRAFESFDDADPFGSTGPFKASADHSPRKGSDSWSAF